MKILEEWPAFCNQVAVKLCVSQLKRDGMYEVIKNTPNNELSEPLFAFKVIEMMMACAMEPLAEQLIAYVGPMSGGA